MKQINNSSNIQIGNINDKDFVIINIDTNNISKLPLQITYYREYGYKNFLIKYDYKTLNISMCKIISKLKLEYLFSMAKEYNLNFKFEGFTRCIYEREILKPEYRWYFENQISFSDNFIIKNPIKFEKCNNCLFNNNCKGVDTDYIKKHTDKEFFPLIPNKNFYDLNKSEIETFSSKEIKKIAKEILKDYKNDNYYLRKKFLFISSFPNNLNNSSQERFIYKIHNRKDDFEKTYNLLNSYFDSNFLEKIKTWLKVSNKISISFGLMGNQKIKKSLFFNIDDLNIEKINKISKTFNLEIKYNNIPLMIGIHFIENKIKFSVYYKKNKLSVLEMKNFVKDIKLENKRLLLKFSNSLIKPLNNTSLCYKYKQNQIHSKKINISMQNNIYRFTQFYALFHIPLSFFEDKEFYWLNFELSDNFEEKIDFCYSLNFPEDTEEMDEGYI